MAEIGEMSVRIGADTGDLEQGLSRADSRIGRLRQSMGRAALVAGKFAAALASAGAVIGGAMVRNSMRNIDAQAKLARSLDTTTASLAALNSVAGDAGVAQGQLTSSLQSFNKRMGDAVNGVGEASKMYERLGLNARELAELPLDERMQAVAEAVNELGTAAERGAALDRLMSGGRSLTVFFQQGADAISDAAVQMEALGVAVTDIDAAKIERANIALAGIGDVITGVSNRIAIKLAPYLEAVADELVRWATETRGFESAVQSSFEFALKAAGWLGDAFHANRMAIAAMNYGVNAFGNAVVQAMRLAADSIGAVIDTQIAGINTVINGLNSIPKVNIDTIDPFSDGSLMQAMRDFANESQVVMENSRRNLEEVMNAEWPSDKIEEFLNRVQQRSKEVSEQVVKDRQSAFENLSDPTATGDGEGEGGSTAEKEKEDYAARLERLREFIADERELEIMRQEQRMEDLRKAKEQGIEIEMGYQELERQLKEKHEQKLTDIEAKEARERARIEDQLQGTVQDLRQSAFKRGVDLLQMFGRENKAAAIAAIALNKGLQIAQTLQNTATAEMRALAELGPIAGPPMAAKIRAWGMTNAALIAAQGLGQAVGGMSGGAGAAGGGGGGGATAGGATSGGGGGTQAPPTQTVTINIEGGDETLFTGRQVRRLIDQINEAQRDGARLRIA